MNQYDIHIFISQAWNYSDHYDKLGAWIFEESWTVNNGPRLNFIDHSIPKEDPIHYARNDAQLKAAIFKRIHDSNVIVIPTGMYASHSKWIQKEIDGSKHYRKPILAVDPFGQRRSSSVVKANADDEAGWNKKTVVTKIWKLYRR